ncbi:hypothetical protein DPMN_043431 [Dreissena polymorpha]|uniref:Uncharacterized protein n=1 Tax=Dreissena polymorpha TaxID=45954 RepID=A0A9D4HZM1_DREPO|nr:hypothetical protein DPMN_043431 [Dreissena polymorpha]
MDSRSTDKKLFYKLMNRQRGSLKQVVEDLYVGETLYSGTEGILEGFKVHFECLAQNSDDNDFDKIYHSQVKSEISAIINIVSNSPVNPVNLDELTKALKTINKGKAADIFGINIEHVVLGPDSLRTRILEIINIIFSNREIPTCLKRGILTPVFKKRRSKRSR